MHVAVCIQVMDHGNHVFFRCRRRKRHVARSNVQIGTHAPLRPHVRSRVWAFIHQHEAIIGWCSSPCVSTDVEICSPIDVCKAIAVVFLPCSLDGTATVAEIGLKT